MRKLHLSPAAAEDIENILRYTRDTWGENQFELYHAILQQAFDSILADPEGPLSKSRDELFPSCRSIRSGHHVERQFEERVNGGNYLTLKTSAQAITW